MAFEFKLPDIGEGTVEGEIVRWLVKPGDKVKADQPVVEVMTDKATVELTAPRAGTILEIRAKEGSVAKVGSVIYVIGEEGEKPAGKPSEKEPAEKPAEKRPAEKAAEKPAAAEPRREPAPSHAEPRREVAHAEPRYETARADVRTGARPRATPATRKLARELGVELERVRGSGRDGRITEEDVRSAAEPSAGAPARAPERAAAGAVGAPEHDGDGAERVERIPFRGIRRKVAEHMVKSRRTAAHFTYVEECDMTEVVALREEAKPLAEKAGIRQTYLPYIIKALIPALRRFPLLNSSLDEEAAEIVLKKHYNIGISVATEQGLIVPVVRRADRLSLFEVAKEIQRLSDTTRAGKVAAEDIRGGTFTITSAGNLGGVFATPIVNFPEVAILGVNQIKKRPIVRPNARTGEDEIAIRHMMFLSISLDLRVVDGAVAAEFMNVLVRLLEKPGRMVLEA